MPLRPLRMPLRPLTAAPVAAVVLLPTSAAAGEPPAGGVADRPIAEERLSFQTARSWRPSLNLNADVAMVYGIDGTLPERLASWRDRGYLPHVMTGVAWGEYADYYYGDWDGADHTDEIQREVDGDRIAHGRDNFYVCPTEAYANYLAAGVTRALGAGAVAVHLEEPEYWARAGYCEAFQREWRDYYGEPWVDPVSSPDAQYRASKLKSYLYRRTLRRVFGAVREYENATGRQIPCYVPTHAMINYASFGVVSPGASLLDVGCDGLVAQTWTGTAREPNHYEGVRRERTFETAFLEYGSVRNLVRAGGSQVRYLNDPIEDDPRRSWADYRTNWENTLVASLLQPDVFRFEIMPWPHRVFERNYPASRPVRRRTPRVPIPQEYATELQAVITALGDLKQPDGRVEWVETGSRGVGVPVSDTMMFQRFGPDHTDHDLASFYGLALPFVMRGVPIEPVQIETAELDRYETLILSYEGQKPPAEAFHADLAAWVRAGGALAVIDDDRDPYHRVREWWNQGRYAGDAAFATPRHHLFDRLGLDRDAEGTFPVGAGAVTYASASPDALAKSKSGGDRVRGWTRSAAEAAGGALVEAPGFVLRRGPYVVAAALGEPEPGDPEPGARGEPEYVPNADRDPDPPHAALALDGRFLALFDPELPVVESVRLAPGGRALLVDLDRVRKAEGVVAAACRVRNETVGPGAIAFDADGLEGSRAVVCVKLNAAPTAVTIDGAALPAESFEFAGGLLRLRFTNSADPRRVEALR